jgi:hypothetical protein
VATSAVAAAALAQTSVKDYVVPVGDEYVVDALFSADDQVPVLRGSGEYRMVGIPDGLGAHRNGNGTSTLYMNHELVYAALSEPYVGGAKNDGAIVSKWILDANGNPLAGKRAYDKVYLDDTLVGDAATTANSTRAFARFCSGSLAGPEQGFDRYIYFANEESGSAPTFDGVTPGGLSVAIFDNNGQGEAHGLVPRTLRLGELARQEWNGRRHGHHGNGGRSVEPDSVELEQPAVHVRRQEGPQPRSDRARAERSDGRHALRVQVEERREEQRA